MNGRDQVIVNGWKHIGGYDLETGKEVWRMTGGGDIPGADADRRARPGVHHQRARQGSRRSTRSSRRRPATSRSRKAKPSNAHIAWSYMRDGGYMQTPIVYGDILYVCRDNGVLTRVRCEDRHASLPGAARRRQDRILRVGGRVRRTPLLHERRRRRLRGEGRARRTSCWRRIRWAKWRWRRRRSRKARCSSARAITRASVSDDTGGR